MIKKEYFERIFVILLAILGVIIVYQIVKFLLGGSWSVENFIVALLFFNVGAVFTMSFALASLRSDFRHLSKKFDYLVKDFKEHIKK